MDFNPPTSADYAAHDARSALDQIDALRVTVAALNQKIDRITFEVSAQIERLKAKVAALEGKIR